MIGNTIEGAIQTLREERARLDVAISSLESLLSGVGAGDSKTAALLAAAGAGPRRRNAPRGLLRQKIREALKAAKKPLAPFELRDAVHRLGYPNKNLKTLYTAVFTTAKADPTVRKNAAGFSLK